METASRRLRTFTSSHHAAPRKLLCLRLGYGDGYGYGYAAPCARPRWCLHHRSHGEDDDFVVACTSRAVLDVGLLSLHDLRADSLIRHIASRSVIQLLSNHCHFNNPIFYAYFFYLARGRSPNY